MYYIFCVFCRLEKNKLQNIDWEFQGQILPFKNPKKEDFCDDDELLIPNNTKYEQNKIPFHTIYVIFP